MKTETFVGAFILLALGLFVYMTFQLGSVRLNLARYSSYTIGFKDVSGLLPQADIKIAGVKVGWVDSVKLIPEDLYVRVVVKIKKQFRLANDSSALVKQEGLLGVKYLEVAPGNTDTGYIEPNGRFQFQDIKPAGIDEVLEGVNALVKQVEVLGQTLQDSTDEARDLMRGVKKRLEKIDIVFSDLGKASDTFQETADVVKKAGAQVTGLLGTAEETMDQFSGGTTGVTAGGSLGKLLTDDQLYRDIRSTSDYARRCIETIRGFGIGVDSHLEVLPSSFFDERSEKKTNVKWYFAGYLANCSGLFGKLGLTYNQKGYAKHSGDFCCDDVIRGHRNSIRLNFQFGKYWYPYCALRAGIFEGTAGVAFDAWLAYSRFRWLSTFEAFDFRGYNRFNNDRRVHLKWLNRLWFNENIYLVFGADDFISKCNKSGFIGAGAYFSLPNLFGGC